MMTNIFIPSYHRPYNNKTAKYLHKIGWDMSKVVVFIDSEADDFEDYQKSCEKLGCKLSVFDMQEARARYDYVHRPSMSRRSAGQARNTFQDYAKENGIDFYCVMDDDTTGFEVKNFGRYNGYADFDLVRLTFLHIEEFMRRKRIGLFGLPQTGDFIGGKKNKLYLTKVMNCSFYLLPYIYRGERGVQDDDASMFVGVWNEGLFTGSMGDGLCLKQMQSVTQKGGLTDNYKENKLLNKSLVCPIQFPSAIFAERQEKNGGRLHHHIKRRYLCPCILKIEGGRDNIAWDTYEEDFPFTNEPKRK